MCMFICSVCILYIHVHHIIFPGGLYIPMSHDVTLKGGLIVREGSVIVFGEMKWHFRKAKLWWNQNTPHEMIYIYISTYFCLYIYNYTWLKYSRTRCVLNFICFAEDIEDWFLKMFLEFMFNKHIFHWNPSTGSMLIALFPTMTLMAVEILFESQLVHWRQPKTRTHGHMPCFGRCFVHGDFGPDKPPVGLLEMGPLFFWDDEMRFWEIAGAWAFPSFEEPQWQKQIEIRFECPKVNAIHFAPRNAQTKIYTVYIFIYVHIYIYIY